MATTKRGKQRRSNLGDYVVSVRMTRDLREELALLAEADRRPIASMIRVLLEDAVAARKKRKS